MIPGTTTFHDPAPLPVLPCNGYRIASDFVGGVSDGLNGAATLAYHRDKLSANKSWFFFDDAIICLGSGISANEDKEVITTLNQSFLHGPVVMHNGTTSRTLQPGSDNILNVSWVLHDNWGYYLPGKASLMVANRQQTGNWNKVLTRMPPTELKDSIFTLWLSHTKSPANASYAYYVFPGATSKNIAVRASNIKVVQNTTTCQAVEIPSRKWFSVVFLKPAIVKTSFAAEVSANKPCILMLSGNKKGLLLSIADPTHLQSRVVIGVHGRRTSNNAMAKYNTVENKTYIEVDLPTGQDAGKTITINLN